MALGIGKAGRKTRRANRQKARKDKIASFRGDGNALKAKFGIGRSLSNKFDQRVGDGLEDLFNGLLGARTSNIPEISAQVKATKEANRKRRQDTLANMSEKRELVGGKPYNNKILVFPQQYFNERGESVKGPEYTAMEWENTDPYAIGESLGLSKEEMSPTLDQSAEIPFPNSIHFRSLPRKKVDTTEALSTIFGEEKWGQTDSSGDVIPEVDPIYDIFLYLPHDLGDAIKVEYESADAGIIDTFFARIFTGGSGVDDMMGESKGIDFSELLNMVKGMLPGGAIIQRAAGAMANPMSFQTFKGVNFGSYTYKFTLSPTSLEESETIRHIIHALKLSTLPGTAGANARIWTMPNEWVVKFQGPIKHWIDFPLTVVCESVDVNYAAGAGYTLMESGAPQAIELTVTFKETTQMSRQKYLHKMSAHTGEDRIFASGTKSMTRNVKEDQSMDVEEVRTKAGRLADSLDSEYIQKHIVTTGVTPIDEGDASQLAGQSMARYMAMQNRNFKVQNRILGLFNRNRKAVPTDADKADPKGYRPPGGTKRPWEG